MIPPSLSLETDKVLLRPMQAEDKDPFLALTQDRSIWTYFTFELNDPAELEKWIGVALDDRSRGIRYPFTIINKSTGALTGSSSYGNISFYDKRIEIGWSWLGKQYQGSGINFHAKFCLLTYAFEVLNFERVEIKTDDLNERAKQGLRKIGCREEGVLRSHMLMPHGRRRDSIYFSIIRNEWESVRNSIFNDIRSFRYSA